MPRADHTIRPRGTMHDHTIYKLDLIGPEPAMPSQLPMAAPYRRPTDGCELHRNYCEGP